MSTQYEIFSRKSGYIAIKKVMIHILSRRRYDFGECIYQADRPHFMFYLCSSGLDFKNIR